MSKTWQNFFTFFLIIATFLIFSTCCYAEKILTFAGVQNIEPLSFEKEGIANGFFPELFIEITKRAGFQARVTLLPFKRLNLYLQKGKINGVISIFYKKERESYLIYSKSPVLISHTRVFVKKGSKLAFNSIRDLFGKKIGMIAGWTVHNKQLKQAIKDNKVYIDATSRYEQNLKKLIRERLDCIIATEQLSWYYINKLGFKGKIVALDNNIAENRTFLAISKRSKNFSNPIQFMKKINMAINSVLSDGTHERLLRKYKVRDLSHKAPFNTKKTF